MDATPPLEEMVLEVFLGFFHVVELKPPQEARITINNRVVHYRQSRTEILWSYRTTYYGPLHELWTDEWSFSALDPIVFSGMDAYRWQCIDFDGNREKFEQDAALFLLAEPYGHADRS